MKKIIGVALILAGVLGLPHHKGQGEQNHHQDESITL